MFFIDIKSVGPRDDADHTVLSPFQVSGDGVWDDIAIGVKNSPVIAQGAFKSHEFYCALPPLYVLSDGTVAPSISLFLKPVYRMLSVSEKEDIETVIDVATARVNEMPNVIPIPRTASGDEASKRLGEILAKGQPLQRLTLATLPNGLLLCKPGGYLQRHPKLFFPGKDDKTIKAKNRRARISFEVLRTIDPWRVESIKVT
jgi:hypothetical protein